MPEELPYIASKAVLQQLTASLAVTLAPRRMTVNCVDPGPNDTGYDGGAAPAGGRGHAGRAVGPPRRHRSAGRVAVRRRGRLGHGPDDRFGRRLVRPGVHLIDGVRALTVPRCRRRPAS